LHVPPHNIAHPQQLLLRIDNPVSLVLIACLCHVAHAAQSPIAVNAEVLEGYTVR